MNCLLVANEKGGLQLDVSSTDGGMEMQNMQYFNYQQSQMLCSVEFKNNIACLFKSGDILVFHGGFNRAKMDMCSIHSGKNKNGKSPTSEHGAVSQVIGTNESN